MGFNSAFKGLNIKDTVIKRDRSAFIVTPVASQKLYPNKDSGQGVEGGNWYCWHCCTFGTDGDELEGTEDDI